jgi:hypothetical protein
LHYPFQRALFVDLDQISCKGRRLTQINPAPRRIASLTGFEAM